MKSPVMNEREAARYIDLSVSFLRQSRMNGDRRSRTPGPPFVRIGRSIRYRVEDLDRWLLEHRVGSDTREIS